MRVGHLLAALALLACAGLPVQAEKRLFVVANHADGYGVDRCLAAGAPCGRPIATAYCKAREFETAVSYRKVERDDVTGAMLPDADACKGRNCAALVAIECSR